MDCYVADGYWVDGYTEQDVCGIGPTPLDPIYSAAWLPPIRLDRKGRRIDEKSLKRITIKAAPEEVKEEVKAAIERIEEAPRNTVDPAILDTMAADMRAIAEMIPAMQSVIVAEWAALAYLAAEQAALAEDEEDIAMLMLAL